MTAHPTRLFRALITGAIVVASMNSGTAQRGPDGTAEISGTVITTSVPATPLPRVLVTISSPSLTPSRTIITDDEGRFVFRNLPGGQFAIVAARPPFVKTAFGAKRPGRTGTLVTLAAGQRVTGLMMPLALGGVITGVVRNADGEAAPGVRVEATPLDAQAGALVIRNADGGAAGGVTVRSTPPDPQGGAPNTPVFTDDRGVYRIFGLPPGKYAVTVDVTGGGSTALTHLSDAEMDELLARLQRRSVGVAPTEGPTRAGGAPGAATARLDSNARSPTYGYAPIYYPGTPDPDQAVTLALAEGEERAGIDLDLQLVRTAAVEGRVSAPSGASPLGTQVTLTRQGQREGAAHALPSSAIMRQADTEGNFRFTGIPPGKYRILARATPMTPFRGPAPSAAAVMSSSVPAADALAGVSWALADVTIDGDDVSGLALMLQPGLRLSGRLAFNASAQTPPRDLTTIRLRLVDVNGASPIIPVGTGRADGTFEITGIIPGTYSMTSALSDAGWWLRSVVVDGRDMLDVPLEFGSAGDVSGAVAAFTDQHTELSGTLQSAANVPAPDYFVVVFSSDRAFWRPASRRVQSTRPSTDGHFALRDLPAGDYLIAALTDLDPSDLTDVSFMEHLIPAALPVHLNDGDKKTQDVKLVK
jgi:uncharacterized protein (DUF2141 family)